MEELDFRFAISKLDPRIGRFVTKIDSRTQTEGIKREEDRVIVELELVPCDQLPSNVKSIFNDEKVMELDNLVYKQDDFLCPTKYNFTL